MNKPTVIFRADGHSQMGLGHLVRSSALAEMLRTDFHCVLAYHDCPEGLFKDLSDGFADFIPVQSTPGSSEDAAELVSIGKSLSEENNPIIVLDGYHFRTDYQRVIKTADLKLVCIDDIHAYQFVADLVINHAPNVERFYKGLTPPANLRSGLEYALLRQPFQRDESVVESFKVDKSDEKVFICFGGSDIEQLGFRISKIALALGYRVELVVGSVFKGKDEIVKFAKQVDEINVYDSLGAKQMANVMTKSDLAIVPSSSILYEVCSLGLPAISGYYVDNQERIYEGFLSSGLIVGVGDFRKNIDFAPVFNSLRKSAENIIGRQAKVFNGDSRNNFISLFNTLR